MTDERMSPDVRLREELEAHHFADDTAEMGWWAAQCGCGHWRGADRNLYTLRALHDQHRARALAPVVERIVAARVGEVVERVEAVLDAQRDRLIYPATSNRTEKTMLVSLAAVRAALHSDATP